METLKETQEKKSAAFYATLQFISRSIHWWYKIDNNNIYLNNRDDYIFLSENIYKIMTDLNIKETKIDEIDIFTKKVIVITLNNWENEEYLKIFFEDNLKNEVKYFIKKILW